MENTDKTKEQLIAELEILRRRVSKLEQAEQLLTALFINSPIGIYIVHDRRFQFVSSQFQQIAGYSEDKLIGMDCLELVLHEDRSRVRENAVKMLKGELSFPYDYRVVTKSGAVKWIMENVASIQYHGRRATLGYFMDITERKRAEELIEHLNLVLRAIRNVNQLITKEKDRDRLLKGICDSLIETRGYYNAWVAVLDESGKLVATAEAGLGKQFLPMVGRLKRGEFTDCSRRALRQSDVVAIRDTKSTCVDCPLAENCHGRGVMIVRLEYGGKVYGVLCVSIPVNLIADEEERALFQEVAGDIAFALQSIEREEEYKQAQEALERQKAYFQQLFDNSPDAIAWLDDTDRIIHVNHGFETLFGYRAEDVEGRFLNETIVPEDRIEEASVLCRATLDSDGVFRKETVRRRKDGSLVDVSTLGYPIQLGSKRVGVFAIYTDITEHKRAEEKYRTLFQSQLVGIFVIDAETMKVVLANQAAADIYGFNSVDEAVGLNLFDFVYPEERERVLKITVKDMFENDLRQVNEFRTITKGGREIWISAVGIRTEYQGKLAGLVSFSDITERKQAEDKLRELDRMKSEFISNISHELRSPLHSIKGFTRLMLEGEVPDPETQKEFLTIVDSQSEHLGKLIDNLLDVSRLESGRFQIRKRRLSIKNIIHDAVDSFYSLANEKSIVINENVPALPEVEGDEERLTQVMFNLLSNAIKFSDDGGSVTVKGDVKDNELLVQVTDRGIGIPEEAMPHLFERFYRVKDSARVGGAGLGLYISKQIIEAHGGHIWAESKAGEGSTFSFILPVGQAGGDSHE